MSSYLELLNLTREPFSNSPDPDAYYRTPTHEDCLNRLEIAIRLRRGLNVVLGEVGTGKSTLCRCLLRSLNEQSGIDVFLLLDAGFEDADEFVRHLCELFAGQRPPEGVARRECISVIQNRVFDKALEQNRNLVLFIDEGQKLSPAALEVLRELLNFETNTEKLLQIVIFGQPELAQIIEGMPNFKDRINEYLYLKPLSMRESIRLVRHRLRLAGGQRAERLFSLGSLIALHRASRGKPRQLMRLGHQMLLALLVGNRTTVTGRMVWAQVARNGSDVETRWGRWLVVALALICVAGGYRWMPEAVKDDAHARLETQTVGQRGGVCSFEQLAVENVDQRRRLLADDRVAVNLDHHFADVDGLLFQFEIQFRSGVGAERDAPFGGFVADRLRHDGERSSYRQVAQQVVARDVGRGADRRSLDGDGDEGEVFAAAAVDDVADQDGFGLLFGSGVCICRKAAEQQAQQQNI